MLLLASGLCKFARKTHGDGALQKSDILCFQPLLSFVPTIFVIHVRSPGFPQGEFRSLPHPPRSSPLPERVRCQKARILGLFHAFERSIWVRFRFVLSFVSDMPFFVFNNILASLVLFFVFFGARFFRVPGLLSISSWPEACPRQSVHKMTTMIGYHRSLSLSSDKCGKTVRTLTCSDKLRPWGV